MFRFFLGLCCKESGKFEVDQVCFGLKLGFGSGPNSLLLYVALLADKLPRPVWFFQLGSPLLLVEQINATNICWLSTSHANKNWMVLKVKAILLLLLLLFLLFLSSLVLRWSFGCLCGEWVDFPLWLFDGRCVTCANFRIYESPAGNLTVTDLERIIRMCLTNHPEPTVVVRPEKSYHDASLSFSLLAQGQVWCSWWLPGKQEVIFETRDLKRRSQLGPWEAGMLLAR